MSTTYTAIARRSGNWWAIEFPDVPGVFTQARRLDQVEAMATEAVALMLDVDASTIDVVVDVVLPKALKAEVARAHAATVEAERRQRDAATRARAVVAKLKAAGLTGADVAVTLGVSPQRVSQLSKG